MLGTTRSLISLLVCTWLLAGCGMRSVLETDVDGADPATLEDDGIAGSSGGGLGEPCGKGGTCDPENLGGSTCELLGAGSGTLSCDPLTCTFDLSLCTGEGIGTGIGTGSNGNGNGTQGGTGGSLPGLGGAGTGAAGTGNLGMGGMGGTAGTGGLFGGGAAGTGGFFGGGSGAGTGGFFGGGGAAGTGGFFGGGGTAGTGGFFGGGQAQAPAPTPE